MRKTGAKISIIGAGLVGSSTAFALIAGGIASEIVIVDIKKEKAEGEAMDLSHGVSFVKPVDVIAGDYPDTKDSDIVIIAAGANQKPGETRLDLIESNLKVFKSILPEVVKYSPNCILLVVSNPVDILSYITFKLSGFPKERVIGSGTVLDTSRLKYLLGENFNIDMRNIHSYIIGEHGDTEMATWSLTKIAGMDMDELGAILSREHGDQKREEIFNSVKNAAYEVIQRKGATYYAVALAVRRIVEVILRDENSILTVSTMLNGEYGIDDVYLGVPSIVGTAGVKKILELPLDPKEHESLKKSASALKELLHKANI